MNTLFSLALVASVLSSAFAADSCDAAAVAASGNNDNKITITISGALDTPANYASVAAMVKIYKADGTAEIPASGNYESTAVDYSTNFVSGGSGIELAPTDALTASSTDWNVYVWFPNSAGDGIIECPVMCTAADGTSSAGACGSNTDNCAGVTTTIEDGGKVKATVSGKVATQQPSGAEMTMTFTATNDEGALGPDTVTSPALVNDFTTTGVEIESTSGLADGQEYGLVVSFPTPGFPSQMVTCASVPVTCTGDSCYVEGEDSAAGLSASVLVLAAFVARAF